MEQASKSEMEISELPSHADQHRISDNSEINRDTDEDNRQIDAGINLASQESSKLSYSLLQKRWTIPQGHPLLKYEIASIEREPFNRSFLGKMIN